MTTDYLKHTRMIKKFNLLTSEPLKNHTSFRVGGPADLLAMPENISQLKAMIKTAADLEIPTCVFGGGTNLLVSDKGIRGLVILTKKLIAGIQKTNTEESVIIGAFCGERLSRVCRFSIHHSLSGLEFAAGIPGTFGGAIAMNAGNSVSDMSQIVTAIDVLDKRTLNIITMTKDSLDFSYRNLNVDGIILMAKLRLKPSDPKAIEENFKQQLQKKNAAQPLSCASAGCFFKNPEYGKSASELIEKAGLKGLRVNDAMVSDIHANYIVNLKNATCQDILSLKHTIQETVFNLFNIKLETEVRVEGEH